MGTVVLTGAARVTFVADGWFSGVVRLLTDGHFKSDCSENARALTFVDLQDVALGSGGATPSRRGRVSSANFGAASRFSGPPGPTDTNSCFNRAAV